MSEGVRFGLPKHDTSLYAKNGIPLPCNICRHDISEHHYLYELRGMDLYRCDVKDCACGAKSEIRGMQLAGNPTEADVERACAELGAGGGVVIDPRRIR